ncbi:hypothetical protein EJ06DRAFT_548631 [Trichodelitschia bisporula]|uniref:Uncharacterized protein n=1 Tax=Trichodelitschia bisporula TaxID=703511 RepID=A0A6G1HX48_9PEZI|nr:hypothetical protein EJ06DRAFT_548631 [Trichodelitschia bisporula]
MAIKTTSKPANEGIVVRADNPVLGIEPQALQQPKPAPDTNSPSAFDFGKAAKPRNLPRFGRKMLTLTWRVPPALRSATRKLDVPGLLVIFEGPGCHMEWGDAAEQEQEDEMSPQLEPVPVKEADNQLPPALARHPHPIPGFAEFKEYEEIEDEDTEEGDSKEEEEEQFKEDEDRNRSFSAFVVQLTKITKKVRGWHLNKIEGKSEAAKVVSDAEIERELESVSSGDFAAMWRKISNDQVAKTCTDAAIISKVEKALSTDNT